MTRTGRRRAASLAEIDLGLSQPPEPVAPEDKGPEGPEGQAGQGEDVRATLARIASIIRGLES